MIKCRVTGELIDKNDCIGICSICENAVEPLQRIPHNNKRGKEDGEDSRRTNDR